MEPSDVHLIQSTLAGDDGAFAMLVARHRRRVFRLAGRFTRNDHELDDVCQEIFIKVYRHLGTYRADAPFEHWLARVAVRACYDLLRRRRRPEEPLLDIDFASEDNLAPAQAKELLDWALAQLPAEDRLVITLLELEEQPVRAIAELTGWSESKVKVRAFRARHRLKCILETNHE